MDGREVVDAYDLSGIVKLGRSHKPPPSGAVPDVCPAEPVVGSGLTVHDVQYIVNRRLNELRFCYQLGLAKSARLAGSMTVRFVVTKQGKNKRPHVLSATLNEEGLSRCVLAALQRWTFPRLLDQSEVTVTQELTFVPAAP